MKVVTRREATAAVAADALVVGLHAEEKRWPASLVELDRRAGGQIKAALDAEKFQAKAGQVTHIHTPALASARLVVAGLGPRRSLTAETLRRAAAAALRRARDLGARTVAIEVFGLRLPDRQRAHAVVEGAILGTYTFDRYKREKPDKLVEELRVLAPDRGAARDIEAGARRGEIFGRATWFARDLVNAPANDVHPTHLATVAGEVAKESGLSLQVFDRDQCAKMGMGAFLGVAAGSQQPPQFIHLRYAPARPRKRVVVIGKGITFDAGGLDLKTAEGMLRMKDDMSGAAAVLAVMRALPQLNPAVEVHGLVAATENMPSGSAIRPGDVLRAMNGTTIEVGNTDAEGRLTLADALCYAREHVKPDEMIDLATLTGACVVALGHVASGLFANDDALAQEVLAAADAAFDRAWRMPLWDDYQDQLKSNFADFANIGGRPAGSVTAACFLARFARKYKWAHLDIAGVAWRGGKDKGATARPVPLLTQFLVNRARKS